MRNLPAIDWSHQPFRAGPVKGSDQTIVNDYHFDALMVSENHKRNRKTGTWSGGGPFFVRKEQKFHGAPKSIPIKIGFDPPPYPIDDVWNARGCSASGFGFPGVQNLMASSKNALIASNGFLPTVYAEAYAKAKPGKPVGGAFQFLYELKDLPSVPLWSLLKNVPFKQIPRVLKDRAWYFKNLESLVGSEYLNIQFGWRPFLSDLRTCYGLWKSLDKTLAKLVAENGRNIRRKATVLSESDTTRSNANYSYPYVGVGGPPATWQSGSTSTSVVSRTTHRIWFSGGFRYWIPDVGSSQWQGRAIRALFGLNPTPAQIWAVMPWTWLTDWFWNMGDIMSNMSQNAAENLVCNYSFIMEQKTEVTEYTSVVRADAVNNGYYRIPAVDHTFQSTVSVETKARIGGGNPYGLGVKLNALSGRQLSILAALGISRSSVK